MAESVLSKLVGTDKDTKKELSSMKKAVDKIAKTQDKMLSMQQSLAKRAAQDKKRDKADSPMKEMFKKQEENEKKKEGWFNKILKILGGLGSALTGVGGGLLKVLGLGALAKTIGDIFSKKFWSDLFLKAFGKGGWMQSAWSTAFGKGGWAQTTWGKAFGKGGWAQSVWTKAFGKGGWASKAFGSLKSTGIGKQITKALGPLGKLFKGGLGKKLGGKLIPGLGAILETIGTYRETGGNAGQSIAAGGGALAGGLGGAKLGAAIGTAIAPGIGTAIGTFLGGAAGVIVGSELGQKMFKAIQDNPAVKALNDWYSGYLKGLFSSVQETFGAFTEMLDVLSRSLSRFNEEVIQPFFKSIGEFVAGTWNKFTDAIKSVSDFLTTTFEPIIIKIGNFLKPIIDPLKDLATKIVDPLVKGLENLLKIFKLFPSGEEFGKSVGNFLLGGPKKFFEFVSGGLQNYADGGMTDGLPNTKLQTGGIVPGSGTGDIYGPVGLPTGSLVMNRNATAMMGLQTGGVVPTMLEPGEAVFGPGSWSPAMAAMNSTIPRFQTGGVVASDGNKDTGSGYQPGGMVDSYGRPVIFSKGGADAWLKMSQSSGGKVKGSDINSAQRSQSKNSAVGGVANSNHLYGNGVDVQSGSSSWNWMKKNDGKYGWKWNNYMGPDGWHFDYTGSNSGQSPSATSPKDGKEQGSSKAGPMTSMMASLSGLGAAGEAMAGVFDIFKEVMGEDSGALMQALGLNNTQALQRIVDNDRASGYTGKEGASVSDPNSKAILNAIADAEGTSKYANNGYNTMFTGKQFSDLSGHPRQKQSGGGYSSDAAGRYQFLSTTWDEMGMSNMSAKSQDKAALKLLAQSGVNISDGLSAAEVYKVGQKWASVEGGARGVPGGSYGGQAKYSAAEFMSMYEKYGGKIEGKQKGGVTNMKPISSDKFIKANEAFAEQMSKGQQPIVIPMPVPSGGGGRPTIQNPGTQTAPPNLPDGPSTIQSAEYFYRLNMGSVF